MIISFFWPYCMSIKHKKKFFKQVVDFKFVISNTVTTFNENSLLLKPNPLYPKHIIQTDRIFIQVLPLLLWVNNSGYFISGIRLFPSVALLSFGCNQPTDWCLMRHSISTRRGPNQFASIPQSPRNHLSGRDFQMRWLW